MAPTSPHPPSKDGSERKWLFLLLAGAVFIAALWTLMEQGVIPIGFRDAVAVELSLSEARGLDNPVLNSPEVLAEAKVLYLQHCEHCHGETGAGDGGEAMMYDPSPSDFTREGMRNIRDGELFYKITEGRKPMPSFKSVLTDDQRWKLVRLIRTFAAQKDE